MRVPVEAIRRITCSRGRRLGALLSCFVPLVLGCGDALALPDTDATVVGFIDSISEPLPVPHGDFGPGAIDVDIDDGAPCSLGVSVTDDDIVLTRANGEREPGSFADLRAGQRIRVWTTDPVSTACPRQVTAEVIEVEVATFGDA